MSRNKSSFGLVALVVVMGVVLFLVAQAWKKLTPESGDVAEAAHTEIREAAGPGDLPRLDDVRQSTDSHAEDVQDALASLD